MSIILPCLFMVALGLLFGGIHMLYGKNVSREDGSDPASPACGGGCAGCGFMACGMRHQPEETKE